MALPENIPARLRIGEDSLNEFKSVQRTKFRADPTDLAKSIVAMSNTKGGFIYLGIEDDGTPSGIGTVANADQLMRQVSDVCLQNITPPLSCTQTKVEVSGATVLVVEVPGFSPDRPFRTNHHVYYLRDANRSREATPAELRRLLQSENYHYDEQQVSGSTLQDLDEAVIRRMIADLVGKPPELDTTSHYLRSFKCLDSQNVPTVAGILFFAKDVGRWFPDARISAVRIKGTAVSDHFLDRAELAGRFQEQIEGAAEFLSKHLSSESTVVGWKRSGSTGPGRIPDAVLREAVVNAVSHRDYRAASQVRIFLYDDRVEIINPGELLNQLTIESVKIGGIKQHRNPVLASLAARLLSTRRESLGLGVPQMFRLMADHGLPDPELDVQGGHFKVVLRATPLSAS